MGISSQYNMALLHTHELMLGDFVFNASFRKSIKKRVLLGARNSENRKWISTDLTRGGKREETYDLCQLWTC
jgi:hypothetical protein